MTRIHEIIPVETDKVNAANALVDEAIATFSKKPDHFLGQSRNTVMFDEQRQAENTSDVKEVVETVDGKLDHVWEAVRDAVNVSMAKEASNASMEARASVIVNGVTLIVDAPGTALLTLEKRLGQIKNLYAAIPTLDPSYAWELDVDAALNGTMKTIRPQEGYKTEKQHDFKVMVPASDKFPAQVSEYTLDRNVAKVTVERQSGMVSPATKARWLKRISDLQTAVKQARQRANMAEVIELPVADTVREFIHG